MPALLTRNLGVICPSCDFLNVVGAVRCMTCGSSTDETTAPKIELPKLQAAPVHKMQDHSSGATVRVALPTDHRADLTPPEAAPPGLKRHAGSQAATPAVGAPALDQAPPVATGAKRSVTSQSGLAPAEAPSLADAPPGPTGSRRGAGSQRGMPAAEASPPSAAPRGGPARPTFTSSSNSALAAAPAGPRFGLTVMAGPARGQRFKLGSNGAQIGQSRGAILFTEDPFISPLHATLSVRDGKLYVRDEDSTSGVLVSVSGTETLPPGAMFCAGLRLFRYVGAIEPNPPWNRRDVVVYGAPLPNNQAHYSFEEILLGGRPGRCLITAGPVLTIGQGRCDFSYPNDEGLAPRHCELAPMPTGVMIRDLSGGLGTFVRASGERALKAGDRIRVGQQTLQVEALG